MEQLDGRVTKSVDNNAHAGQLLSNEDWNNFNVMKHNQVMDSLGNMGFNGSKDNGALEFSNVYKDLQKFEQGKPLEFKNEKTKWDFDNLGGNEKIRELKDEKVRQFKKETAGDEGAGGKVKGAVPDASKPKVPSDGGLKNEGKPKIPTEGGLKGEGKPEALDSKKYAWDKAGKVARDGGEKESMKPLEGTTNSDTNIVKPEVPADGGIKEKVLDHDAENGPVFSPEKSAVPKDGGMKSASSDQTGALPDLELTYDDDIVEAKSSSQPVRPVQPFTINRDGSITRGTVASQPISK